MSDVADPPTKTTVTVTIDGKAIEAKPGELVIAAAERTGTFIPRFCWHPRMEAVGMCRQCLVEQDSPRGKMLVVSCMTQVAEGMVIDTTSDTVRKAQEGVLEFLLINHPLDCPVCDKGGECPLQDQAFSHGPGESRFVEEKRHYEKPIAISPLVQLDRERCILCDRCTRFASDVAGDPLIQFTSRGNQTQVLTFPDLPFASYFSGNTVQICPVGALTATPYRFKARPWDLDQLESTCTTCSVGCRITVQSSRDELLRYQGVDSDSVNWGWLCDKGRFGFGAVNSDQRLRSPMVRQGDQLVPSTWTAALDAVARALTGAVASDGPGSIAVIGGARGTNEDAYAWAKLAKSVIGTPHTDAQLDDGLPAELVLGLPRATIDEAAAAPTVVLLAPDLKEELPVLYLRLRHAAEKRTTRLIEIGPRATGLSPYCFASIPVRPGEEGAAVRALLAGASIVGVDDALVQSVRAQLGSGPVVVVLGRGSVASSDRFVTDAALTLHEALPQATFLPALRRGNVFGALDAGLAPGLLPGRATTASAELRAAWGDMSALASVSTPAKGTGEILRAAADGRIKVLVLLGADPLADVPDTDLAARALAKTLLVVAVDTHPTASVQAAHVVLPAAAFGEKAGTTTNLEGRVSRMAQKVNGPGTVRADWVIATEIAERMGASLGFGTVTEVWSELQRVSRPHRAVTGAALRSAPDGVVAAGASLSLPTVSAEVPKVEGYSLRLATGRTLYDAGVVTTFTPALSGLPGSAVARLHPYDFDRLATGRATTVKIVGDRSSLTLPAVSDPGVARGTVWVAWGQPGTVVGALVNSERDVNDVRVESLS
jgi:NADH-quinone oxidoreductase subunit G